eukprot:1546033-Amphidinium_carterae.2
MLNHNTSVGVHADRFNTGRSSLLSWGEHREGHLWIECSTGKHSLHFEGEQLWGRIVPTKGHWQSFDAHSRHSVLPALPISEGAEAERYSISLFCPGCPGRLSEVTPELWLQLHRAGFPVDEWQEETPALNSSSTSAGHNGLAGVGSWGPGMLTSAVLTQSADGSSVRARKTDPFVEHQDPQLPLLRSRMTGVLAGSAVAQAGAGQSLLRSRMSSVLAGSAGALAAGSQSSSRSRMSGVLAGSAGALAGSSQSLSRSRMSGVLAGSAVQQSEGHALSRSRMSGVSAGSATQQADSSASSRSWMSGVLAGSVISSAQVSRPQAAAKRQKRGQYPDTACMCTLETQWQQLQRKR